MPRLYSTGRNGAEPAIEFLAVWNFWLKGMLVIEEREDSHSRIVDGQRR